MYYLVIYNEFSGRMWWTGKDITFKKIRRKAYPSLHKAEKEKSEVVNKFNYLKDLLSIERN